MSAVRLRQENLLAQQRLKRKLAARERQRRDKKQHAMITAQKQNYLISQHSNITGSTVTSNANNKIRNEGMQILERRLLGTELLKNDAFPSFVELRKQIGERTNINIDSPTVLLEKMLHHTSEASGLKREVARLRTKFQNLTQDIPVLENLLKSKLNDTSSSTHNRRRDRSDSRNRYGRSGSSSNSSGNTPPTNDDDDVATVQDAAAATAATNRTIWEQKSNIDDAKVEYDLKFEELQIQMNTIYNASSGIQSIHTLFDNYLQGVSSSKGEKNEQEETQQNDSSNKLIDLLKQMVDSSIIKKAGGNTTAEDRATNNAVDAVDVSNNGVKVTGLRAEEDQHMGDTAVIIDQVQLLFNQLSTSINVVRQMNRESEKEKEGKDEQEDKRQQQRTTPSLAFPVTNQTKRAIIIPNKENNTTNINSSNNNSKNVFNDTPKQLRLNKSSEQLLSDNNVRVTAAKFKKELSNGERQR